MSDLLNSVRNPEVLAQFLLKLVEAGRKQDCYQQNIRALIRFDGFLAAGSWLPKSKDLLENVEQMKDLFYPVAQFHVDRLTSKRNGKAEEISNFFTAAYASLLSGDVFDQVSSMIAGKDLSTIL